MYFDQGCFLCFCFLIFFEIIDDLIWQIFFFRVINFYLQFYLYFVEQLEKKQKTDVIGCVLQLKIFICNIFLLVSNSKFLFSDLFFFKLNFVNCDSVKVERCEEIIKKDGQNCLVEKMSERLQNVSGLLDIRSFFLERFLGQMLLIYEIFMYYIV